MCPQIIPSAPSPQSRVAAIAAAGAVRPLLEVLPSSPRGVALTRLVVAASMAVLGPAVTGSRIIRVQRPGGPAPGVRGEWVRGPRAERDDAVMFYVHGSGYSICSARTHRGITTRLSDLTGLPVFACDYRLAPRHRFPGAADDVRAGYDWLIGEGHQPDRIVVAGDSAGGHLAVDLVLQLLHESQVPPAALALFSPLFDVSLSLATRRERMQRDPLFSVARAARLLDLYVTSADRADRRIALSFDGAAAFPPTLIQAGSREILAADAIQLARALRGTGVACELEIWSGQMHVFQALARFLPEGRAALQRCAEYVLAAVDTPVAAPLALVEEAT